MEWIKAPEQLKALIENLMAPVDCERRPMFGYPAYFINKHLFSGLFQDKLFVRLSPDQLEALQREFPGVSSLEPMPGRPMKACTVIPTQLRENPRRMPRLVEEAAEWCRSLPPKAPKGRKPSPGKKRR